MGPAVQRVVSDGYAYVAVTAQTAGMADLKAWDPVRYGTLGDSNDGQSYDIFTQTAEVIKADSATLLGGLTPKVIADGDSQSAFRLDTYVNAIQPLTHAFTAFLGVGRAVVAAPIGNGLVALARCPALIRTNNTAPFIQLNTQGDVLELQSGLARQPDNSDLRTWEVAGAAHIDAHEGPTRPRRSPVSSRPPRFQCAWRASRSRGPVRRWTASTSPTTCRSSRSRMPPSRPCRTGS